MASFGACAAVDGYQDAQSRVEIGVTIYDKCGGRMIAVEKDQNAMLDNRPDAINDPDIISGPSLKDGNHRIHGGAALWRD